MSRTFSVFTLVKHFFTGAKEEKQEGQRTCTTTTDTEDAMHNQMKKVLLTLLQERSAEKHIDLEDRKYCDGKTFIFDPREAANDCQFPMKRSLMSVSQSGIVARSVISDWYHSVNVIEPTAI
ncbi:hypothetical protein PROFUN_09649 [Planoprotostelium fungivorum]|uniref:Uncharacterized protein n=1 Tax=Planoprotostelium fungivorum TaxID=1890364 RepID=A0A2P6MNX1_9EUKA|nr:hypothetical protein PROFUN_09649 [Planoprotostelium fungivorum]